MWTKILRGEITEEVDAKQLHADHMWAAQQIDRSWQYIKEMQDEVNYRTNLSPQQIKSYDSWVEALNDISNKPPGWYDFKTYDHEQFKKLIDGLPKDIRIREITVGDKYIKIDYPNGSFKIPKNKPITNKVIASVIRG